MFGFCSECGKIFRDFIFSLGKQEVNFCFISFCRKIGSATNQNSRLSFLALIAVLDSSGLLGLVAPRRLFKLEGLAIMQEQNREKYIIYVRKSTDVEDKQVLSVEAQIVELREYAADNNLHIVDTVIERKSAKTPGRNKFNAMMLDIENGKANGVLSWHPDRLARNSVDGGHIIYLLDQALLVTLKFPSFWFENTQ